jgi:hypothetical protein
MTTSTERSRKRRARLKKSKMVRIEFDDLTATQAAELRKIRGSMK